MLSHLRKKIDELDARIIRLLNDRAAVTLSIGREKVKNKKPMYSYTSLIVRDFGISQINTLSDQVGSARYQQIRNMPEQLSALLVRDIAAHRIYMNVSREGTPNGATVLLTGTFQRVGRFKISVEASLRDGVTGEEIAQFRQTLWDVLDTNASFATLSRELAEFIDRIQFK